MGFYGNRVAPRIINLTCGHSATAPLRQRVCADLSGEVIEIGFGSGLNIPFYPASVTSIAAVEPSDLGWELATERLGTALVPIERSALDGQRLPFADNTFDAALSTWTLCSIPDAAAALLEIHRVLRPGAAFHFAEHGLAPDERVRRRQYRLEFLHRALFGGCHLTRPITDLIVAAGFTLTEIDVFYEEAAAQYAAAMSLGTAVKTFPAVTS